MLWARVITNTVLTIQRSVNQDSIIDTDAFSSHIGLEEHFQHFAFIEGRKTEQVVTNDLCGSYRGRRMS